jgi:hypothetical protein
VSDPVQSFAVCFRNLHFRKNRTIHRTNWQVRAPHLKFSNLKKNSFYAQFISGHENDPHRSHLSHLHFGAFRLESWPNGRVLEASNIPGVLEIFSVQITEDTLTFTALSLFLTIIKCNFILRKFITSTRYTGCAWKFSFLLLSLFCIEDRENKQHAVLQCIRNFHSHELEVFYLYSQYRVLIFPNLNFHNQFF